MNGQHNPILTIRSQFPMFFVDVEEEQYILDLSERIANLGNEAFFIWDSANGLRREGRPGVIPQTNRLFDALRYISKAPENGIYVLLSAQPYLGDPTVRHLTREISQGYHKTAKTLIFVNSSYEMPPELMHASGCVELSVYDVESVRAVLRGGGNQWALAQDASLRETRAAVDALTALLSDPKMSPRDGK